MFTPFFRSEPVNNLEDAKNCDHKEYARFFHYMLDNGFYMPPSGYEVSFLSAAHTDDQIDKFLSDLSSF